MFIYYPRLKKKKEISAYNINSKPSNKLIVGRKKTRVVQEERERIRFNRRLWDEDKDPAYRYSYIEIFKSVLAISDPISDS